MSQNIVSSNFQFDHNLCGDCAFPLHPFGRLSKCNNCNVPRHALITCDNTQCQVGKFYSVALKKKPSELVEFRWIFCSTECAKQAEVVFEKVSLFRTGESAPFVTESNVRVKALLPVSELVMRTHEKYSLEKRRPEEPFFGASTQMQPNPGVQVEFLDPNMLCCNVERRELALYPLDQQAIGISDNADLDLTNSIEENDQEEGKSTRKRSRSDDQADDEDEYDDDDDDDEFDDDQDFKTRNLHKKSKDIADSGSKRGTPNNTRFFQGLSYLASAFTGSRECQTFLRKTGKLTSKQAHTIGAFKTHTCVALKLDDCCKVLVFANLNAYQEKFGTRQDISEPVYFKLKQELLAGKHDNLRGVCVVELSDEQEADAFVSQANSIGFTNDASLCALIHQARNGVWVVEEYSDPNLINGGDDEDDASGFSENNGENEDTNLFFETVPIGDDQTSSVLPELFPEAQFNSQHDVHDMFV